MSTPDYVLLKLRIEHAEKRRKDWAREVQAYSKLSDGHKGPGTRPTGCSEKPPSARSTLSCRSILGCLMPCVWRMRGLPTCTRWLSYLQNMPSPMTDSTSGSEPILKASERRFRTSRARQPSRTSWRPPSLLTRSGLERSFEQCSSSNSRISQQ